MENYVILTDSSCDLPKDLAAEAFVNMDSDYQELLIHSFSDSELKAVMDELYVDDAVDIIEELPANIVKRILMHTSADMRKDINELLNYPKSSAGSIMTTEYIAKALTLSPRTIKRRSKNIKNKIKEV